MLPSWATSVRSAQREPSLSVLLNLLVEAAFVLVFAGALLGYLRRRDPLAREVALAFSGLASLLLLEVVRNVIGPVPQAVSRAATLLLLAQPLFTLRLLDRIRPIPRPLLPVAYAAYAILSVPLLVLPAGAPGLLPLALVAFAMFVGLEAIAAGFLLAEARRRSGSARVRMVVAGLSTALMAVAILVLLVGVAGGAVQEVVSLVARSIALVAAIGYAIAFMPPRILRRSWQAGASYRLGGRLLETADASDPDLAWQRYVELAVDLSGAEAGVVRAADATVRASVGLPNPPAVTPADVASLLDGPLPPVDLPVARAAEPWAGIGARFLTIVRISPGPTSLPAVLLLYSRRRSLFGEDDRELLTGLGAQASVLAERAALAADLRRTVVELRSANAAKSDFLASMSHELRTPLNAIIGFSELMRMEPAAAARVAVPTEWVEHVAGAGQHLLDLINDVLDLAKVEAGRLELETARFDIDAAAVEWLGGIRPLADRKQIRLVLAGMGGVIEADRGRLRQVVYNLLSNAIKFTPDGGAVRLELARTDDHLTLSVVDTGVGIAPEDHDAVFEEFRQVGRPGDRQPGTGLGLALTRRLVQAHGGQVTLDSEYGHGSRFTVTLPQAHRDETAPAARAPVSPSAREGADAGEVLVIEDDPGAVRLLRESLEGAGWHVRVAADGPSGLAAARDRRPDAIVLDVLLPGIDGWDVLRTVKDDTALREVPVLMLTVVDEREVGLALGAADYLVKPVERAALLARLGAYTFTTKVRDGEVRVLVVDDDPAAVDAMAGGLEQDGFVVARAYGGREALDLARNTPPDIVVCDLVMPDVDGFALVAALKADARTRDAPILVVTGHDITAADKARLNGNILGIVAKGADMGDGLRRWLGHVARQVDPRIDPRIDPRTSPP